MCVKPWHAALPLRYICLSMGLWYGAVPLRRFSFGRRSFWCLLMGKFLIGSMSGSGRLGSASGRRMPGVTASRLAARWSSTLFDGRGQRLPVLSQGVGRPMQRWGGFALSLLSGALLMAGSGVMAQQQNCSWKVINGERVYVCCDGNGYCWRSNP